MSPTTNIMVDCVIADRVAPMSSWASPANRSERNSSSVSPTVIRSPGRMISASARPSRDPFRYEPLVLVSMT